MGKNGAHAHIWEYSFGHNLALFRPIWLIFVGTQEIIISCQEIIIDRLVMRIMHIFELKFYRRKMGVPATEASKSLRSQNSNKIFTHWVDLLGRSLFRNHVFSEFSGVNLPPHKEGGFRPQHFKKISLRGCFWFL